MRRRQRNDNVAGTRWGFTTFHNCTVTLFPLSVTEPTWVSATVEPALHTTVSTVVFACTSTPTISSEFGRINRVGELQPGRVVCCELVLSIVIWASVTDIQRAITATICIPLDILHEGRGRCRPYCACRGFGGSGETSDGPCASPLIAALCASILLLASVATRRTAGVLVRLRNVLQHVDRLGRADLAECEDRRAAGRRIALAL